MRPLTPLQLCAVLTCVLCLFFAAIRDDDFGVFLQNSPASLAGHSLPAAAPAHHALALPALPLYFLNTSSGQQVSTAGRYLGMSVKLGMGLNNVMMLLAWCLYAGRLSGRAVILPATMPSRRAMRKQYWSNSAIRDAESSGWFQVPFGSVVDVPYLVACAARQGVLVVQASEDSSAAQLQSQPPPPDYFMRYGADVERLMVAEQAPLVSVDMTHWVVFNGASPNAQGRVQLLALDTCVTWAPGLEAATQRLVAEAALRQGASLSTAMAVHARLEDDLIEVHTDMDDKGVVDRVAGKITACMQRVVAEGWPPQAGSPPPPIVLLTGDSIHNPKYKALLDAFPGRCTSKEELAPEATAQLLEAQGLDGGTAVLDQSIASHAAVFVGYAASSFSQRVAQDRLRRGLPSYLYNEADKDFAGCSRVVDPWTVQWEDGTATEYVYKTEEEPGSTL
jgi:hypothetical protein